MKWIWVWWISLAIKIILAVVMPLSPDEAYYWFWSKHLSLSYFDHPPMVAYWFYLGSWLENFYQAVRVPSVVLGHLAFYAWDLIARNYLTIEKRKIFWILFLINPLTGIIGGVIVTPDLPLMLFSALVILYYEKIKKNPTAINYILLGLFLGLGFLSKYHIVFLVPILLIQACLDKKIKLILNKKMLLLIVMGAFTAFPVLWWNIQNQWISFKFQMDHGFGQTQFNFESFGIYLLGQMILIGFVYFENLKSIFSLKNWNFLKTQYAFIFSFFAFSSFKGHVEANWTAQAYAPLWIFLANETKYKKLIIISVFWILVSSLAVSHWVFPWWKSAPSKLNETHQYQEIIEESKSLSPLYASHLRTASLLSFYQKRKVYKLKGSSRFDFYDMIKESVPQTSVFYYLAQEDHPISAQHKVRSLVKIKKIGLFNLWKVELKK